MYDVVQVLVKLAVTAVVVLGLVQLWRADLDIRSLFGSVRSPIPAPLDFLPTRNQAAIYLDGVVVGQVFGAPQIDETARTVIFEEIFGVQGDVQRLLQDELEFRRWRIRLRHIETMTMVEAFSPRPGPHMKGVSAVIVGERSL